MQHRVCATTTIELVDRVPVDELRRGLHLCSGVRTEVRPDEAKLRAFFAAARRERTDQPLAE